MKINLTLLLSLFLLWSCGEKYEKKGFQVSEVVENEAGEKVAGLSLDTIKMETRPSKVLLTKNPAYRITPIFKVNTSKPSGEIFVGSPEYYSTWGDEDDKDGNNWNGNFMPGTTAMYGYNLVNLSLFDFQSKKAKYFFPKPVLIKTFYYPAFSKDSMDFKPVERNYYMVSVYDEDSNNDGFLNLKDLRRFYHFDIKGENKQVLVPPNYSVVSSQYDAGNDFMFVYAKKDSNNNGEIEESEPLDVFWIDVKNPLNRGLQYQAE
ncbi:MAG: hypothetical protein C4K58_01845 [Flavobacteriaceae bacterium]|nr:MAG: hypothetical protein C4K58_01845 [Flavobacteriaceae bacterium]